MARRVWVAVVIGMALLGLSCSSEAESAGGDQEPQESSTTASAGDEIAEEDAAATTTTDTATMTEDESEQPATTPEVLGSWTSAGYQALASEIASCGDVVLFESLSETEGLEIVAVDVATGGELYRLPVDRGRLLRGQHGSVDHWCDGGLVFGLDGSQFGAAYDLATGERLWSTEEKLQAVTSCGPDLCGTRGQGEGEWLFSGEDGTLVSFKSLEDNRVLASDEDGFRLYPLRDRVKFGPQQFAGYRQHTLLWVLRQSDIREITGHTFTPSTGWWALDTDDDSIGVQYLGPTLDEDAAPEDRVTAGGVVFAYNKETGELLWARDNMVGCAYPEPVFCHFAGYTDGNYDFDRFERIDPNTGETIWEYQETRYPNTSLQAENLEVTFYRDGEVEEQYHLDYATGERLAEPPEHAYEVCSTWDGFEEDEDFRYSVYSEAAGETMTWSASEHLFPCDETGAAIDDPATVAAEPLLLQDVAEQTGGGWFVTFDGENLRGIKLGP